MASTGMIWPLAQAAARRGYAVRRAGWENALIAPGTTTLASNHLRWLVYHNSIFHTAYLERGDDYIGSRVTRPTRNVDFSIADFLANDWTIQPPGCDGEAAPPGENDGFYPYPEDGTEPPSNDPAFPNVGFGACPTIDVPLLDPTTPETPPVFPYDPQPPGMDDGTPPQPPVPNGTPPQPPASSGGFGGFGGGSGSSSRRPRKPRPKPAPAPLTLSIDPALPSCLVGEESRNVSVSVRIALGAAPTPAADGIYWVSVVCMGQIFRINMEPLDEETHVFTVSITPGVTEFPIQGTAYLPIRRLTSRDIITVGPVPECECVFPAAGYGVAYELADLPATITIGGSLVMDKQDGVTSIYQSGMLSRIRNTGSTWVIDTSGDGGATWNPTEAIVECLNEFDESLS